MVNQEMLTMPIVMQKKTKKKKKKLPSDEGNSSYFQGSILI
jgi:hypothetical protein